MEAAGLAIGVAALVTLFKTCLDMYDAIECGRRLGSEYEVLTTKVGVERVRLSIWGETVGLLVTDAVEDLGGPHQGIDPRLSDARIVKAVADILSCMVQLFEDTGSLTRRYGLQASSRSADDSRVIAIAQINAHSALVSTFRETYRRLQANQRGASSLMASARWAVKDKKRFQRFIDDLRGFNDGLCALFPDVDEVSRQTMLAEIKEATDLHGLQVVEQAVVDMDHQKLLAEAASIRITEISQYTASILSQEAETETETETVVLGGSEDAVSAIHAGGVNVSRLARQLEKLDVALRADLKGSLQLSIWNSFGTEYHGFLGWEGIRNDEYYTESDKEAEYVRHPHLAWSLMYATEKKDDSVEFSAQDSEASRKFEGKFPGTRTVEGYAADFSAWARVHRPDPNGERFSYSTNDLPEHKLHEMVSLLRDLQLRRSLPWGETERTAGEELRKLTGGGINTAAGVNYDWSLQVIDSLSQLNRVEDFDDVREGGSLGTTALNGRGLLNFLFQMILAYEVKLRLSRCSGHTFGGLTKRAIATIQASERWIDGVWVKLPDIKRDKVELHSLVHERQVEGLIRFAELMAWPALGEMREFIEDAYANLRAGTRISINLWDWLFGITLPGNGFVFTVMSALVASTPSLAKLGAPGYFASGLVLRKQSYWRARFVLGRVLGGMKSITMRAANGWVGPCPVPVLGPPGTGGEAHPGWWRVLTRDAPFSIKKRVPLHVDADEMGLFSRVRRVGGDSSRAEWVRTMGDQSKWILPMGPANSSDVVTFQGMRLKRIGQDVNPSQPDESDNAVGPSTGKGDRPNETSSTDNPEGRIQEDTAWRAILELTINNQPVSFTLYNNPTFIAAPRCIDGPHAVHERDLPKLQHILRVGQLPGHLHTDDRVLIIDATGQGECELAARAWCAEYGQHAIVRRGGGTCFACGVRAAGAEGLGVGCLIWT